MTNTSTFRDTDQFDWGPCISIDIKAPFQSAIRTINYPPTRFLRDSHSTFLPKAGEDRVEIVFQVYLRELESELEFESVIVPRYPQPIHQIGQRYVKGPPECVTPFYTTVEQYEYDLLNVRGGN